MSIPRIVSIRPLKTIGIIVAIHSLIYGIGYLTGLGGFTGTLLYNEVGTILPPEWFGVLLSLVGGSLAVAYIKEHAKAISTISTVQSFVWLFATFVYFINGDWLVGLAIAFVWSILSGYMAFSFKNRERTINEAALQWFLDDTG